MSFIMLNVSFKLSNNLLVLTSSTETQVFGVRLYIDIIVPMALRKDGNLAITFIIGWRHRRY